MKSGRRGPGGRPAGRPFDPASARNGVVPAKWAQRRGALECRSVDVYFGRAAQGWIGRCRYRRKRSRSEELIFGDPEPLPLYLEPLESEHIRGREITCRDFQKLHAAPRVTQGAAGRNELGSCLNKDTRKVFGLVAPLRTVAKLCIDQLRRRDDEDPGLLLSASTWSRALARRDEAHAAGNLEAKPPHEQATAGHRRRGRSRHRPPEEDEKLPQADAAVAAAEEAAGRAGTASREGWRPSGQKAPSEETTPGRPGRSGEGDQGEASAAFGGTWDELHGTLTSCATSSPRRLRERWTRSPTRRRRRSCR